MNTIAWLFILAAAIVFSAASRGRVLDLKDDLGDAFLALVTGDNKALGEVMARKGTGNDPDQADLSAYKNAGATAGSVITEIASKFSLSAEAIKLGKAARGYKWTRTGPDWYDCSGLVWRACKNVGAYSGPRFTTHSFALMTKGKFTRVTTPAINDVVVWNHANGKGHMGVVSGPDQFYSARSVNSGIGFAKISTWSGTAKFYRAGSAQSNFGTGPTKG